MHVTNLLHRDEWLLNRACISYIENAQIQVEGGEKKEKVNNKQESEILFTQHDLEKQLKEWATQPAQEGDAPVQPDSLNSGLGDAARWIEWEGNEAKEGESVMGDVMLDHRTNDLLLAEIGALQRDDVVENRFIALDKDRKEKSEDGRRDVTYAGGNPDKLQPFYCGPHVVLKDHQGIIRQLEKETNRCSPGPVVWPPAQSPPKRIRPTSSPNPDSPFCPSFPLHLCVL